MAYGVTPTGYLRKDLATIISELETAWKGVYGDGLNVSAASPAGQIIGITAAMLSDAWEEAQNTFDAYNPDAAAGVSLSNLVQINGIERRLASASTVLLTLTMSGSGTLTVPAGSIVSDSNGIQWTTDSNASRSGSGTITDVAATCTETGPITALASTITTMVTNVSGWTGVTNPAAATTGLNEETDFELRVRRAKSVAFSGMGTIDSMIAALGSVSGIQRFKVYENATGSVDADGNVANSIRIVAEGGSEIDILRVIYDRKPAGINTNGAYYGSVIGTDQLAHLIRYDRVSTKLVNIKVTKTTYSNYPVDGDSRIKQAIVDFFASQLAAGLDYAIGDDVVASRIYTPVNTVPGVKITSIFIAFDPTVPTVSTDLTIGIAERAITAIANITVV